MEDGRLFSTYAMGLLKTEYVPHEVTWPALAKSSLMAFKDEPSAVRFRGGKGTFQVWRSEADHVEDAPSRIATGYGVARDAESLGFKTVAAWWRRLRGIEKDATPFETQATPAGTVLCSNICLLEQVSLPQPGRVSYR